MKVIRTDIAGTGYEGRGELIRRHCRDGAAVQLTREPNNPHDSNAIAVTMNCGWMGAPRWKWKSIGYINAKRAASLAKQLDSGTRTLHRAMVSSYWAPNGGRGRDGRFTATPPWPRVTLEIELNEVGKTKKAKGQAGPKGAAQPPVKTGVIGRLLGKLFGRSD